MLDYLIHGLVSELKLISVLGSRTGDQLDDFHAIRSSTCLLLVVLLRTRQLFLRNMVEKSERARMYGAIRST